MTADITGLLTVPDFCTKYTTSRSNFYKLAAAGAIKPVKSGRRTLIPLTEAERWVNTLPPYRPGGSRVRRVDTKQ